MMVYSAGGYDYNDSKERVGIIYKTFYQVIMIIVKE